MRARAALLFVLSLGSGATAHAGQTWLAGSMTDAGPHPRTVLRANDLPVIHDRLTRAPYIDMLASIQSQADRDAVLDDHSKNNESLKAAIAKSCAFLYAVERRFDAASGTAAPFADEPARRAYAEKAAQHLLWMHTQSFAKGIQPDGGLGTSEALHMWSQAYDLLAGAGFDFTVEGQQVGPAAVQAIADLAADLWTDYMVKNAFILRGYLNNHRSKAAAALGMAAIALNGADFTANEADGRHDLDQWVDFAMRYLDLVLMSLETDQEGTYQESGGYYSYAAVNHIPFFRAWHHYTGGASYTYQPWKVDEAPYYAISATGPYEVKDFWSSAVFHAQLDYIWKTMLPDRTAPPFDDCTPGVSFPWGWAVDPEFPNAPLYRWAWESSPYGLVYPGLAGAADMIAAFDDSIPPSPPPAPPDTVLPIAGNVVFRPSWDTDANALVVNAEHGNAGARTYTRWGDAFDGLAGHEHLEPASFMVYAGQEPLIIDSGYLGWPDHGKVNNPYNHNILLVDGKGPQMPSIVVPESHSGDGGYVLDEPWREGGWTLGPDGDAYLVDSFVSEHMKIAIVKTRYKAAGGFEWARRFVWIDDKYLAVYDEFEARDGKAHEVRLLLHGNGGGTSGGQYEEIERGALWTQADSRVRVIVLSDLPMALSTTVAIHDRRQWDERTHNVLNATVDLPAGAKGRFMTVMVVEKKTGSDFETKKLAVSAGMVVWDSGGEIGYGAALGKNVEIEEYVSDADFSAMRGNGLGFDVTLYGKAIRELGSSWWGSPLIAGGGEVFLGLGNDEVDGYQFEAAPVGNTEVQGSYGGGTGVCGLTPSDDAMTKVTKPGNGPFHLSTSETIRGVVAAVDLMPSYEINPYRPALDVLKPVTLSGAKSCDPSGGALSYSWRVTMKPEMSAAELSAPSAVETGFTPDLPGSYRIELQVSGGGATDVASVLLDVEGDVREARAAMDGGTDGGGMDEGTRDEGREDEGSDSAEAPSDAARNEGKDDGTKDDGTRNDGGTGPSKPAGSCGCAIVST
ncbi:MAG: heparinase II/III family protein [Deltaproteobacteria bacterium]|nr:heparinase II/III family protein [Deltaproteobacteria bacterium]